MTTKVPIDDPEAKRLWRIADQAYNDYRDTVMKSFPDKGVELARKKLSDCFDAYHRYLKQQN